ncbi:MAG: hypothetical protein HY908_31500, partial [Myxococcales bacterium]|nr:hypothetical protein [Myxococcales bacterium]
MSPRLPFSAATVRAAWLGLGLALVTGCGSTTGEAGKSPPAPAAPQPYLQAEGLPGDTRASFDLHRDLAAEGAFWQLPFPSEARRGADGRIVWRDVPGYDSFVLGAGLADADAELDAFSVAPVVYFRFSGPLREGSLPRPEASLRPDAQVQLVDVDPTSAHRGERVPLLFRYYTEDLAYVPRNTLAAQPVPGFMLRPGTLYAAVVLRSLGDAAGKPLGTARDLELTKWTLGRPDPGEERARAAHAPAFELLEQGGIARADVAAVALFRTQVPARSLTALVDSLATLAPGFQPKLLAADWLPADGVASYGIVRGYYCTPSFQTELERAPYLDRGGMLVRGEGGRPTPVPVPASSRYNAPECGNMLRARFVLTVPRTPMPPGGYPLLVVAHGTTGDAMSYLGQRDFAGWAAQAGVAVVGTDQPLHGGADPVGARPGSLEEPAFRILGIRIPLPVGGRGSEMLFYNALRPAAIVGNLHQAAADMALLGRLLLATDFGRATRPDGAPLLAPAEGGPALPRFDPGKLMVAGHSQGSQSAALVAAVDPLVRGVVLSGAGGNARIGTTRRQDIPARPVIETLLGLKRGELDEYHPFMAMAQTFVDSVDPQSYAPLYAELLPGRAGRSVLLFEGPTDSMNVAEVSEALATALGATPLEPVLRPV